MTTPDWLPEIISFHGNWEEFIEEVYGVFERDFKQTRPSFRGLAVTHDTRLEYGREAGFWHIVQRDDASSGERLPDLKRCGRITWTKPTVDYSQDPVVSVWEKEVKKANSPRQTRVYLWLENEDYLIALRKTPSYMVLITAFCVDHESYRRKLRKERDEYYEKQKPPREAT